QLDGVGKRGLERIVEDVLDPNRNVDPAFMSTFYALSDGRVLSGLFRRKEGQDIVLVDQAGKEQVIPVGDVEEQRQTRLSPMPADFGNIIPEAEFLDLMAYLLDGTGEPAPKK
ncbi:PVC-type heme-binding CxxCH protein, partial [Singulisphaera rosea]